MEPQTILVVDDEPAQRSILAGYLRKKKHHILEAGSVVEAMEHLQNNPIAVILTDFRMPGATGHDLLLEVRSLAPEATTVIMTAFGTIEGAVQAMRDGAYDYITKPINLHELDLLILRIAERRRLLSENRLLKEQLAGKFSFQGVIYQSGEMESVLNTAGRVADSKASILITGESGTGKELIARVIHFSSPRKAMPFIAVNCAALNENLLESELFGHERGAFTGAEKQRHGRFELANGGTLFLDEIGDLPPVLQVKLLRVLQTQKFERVGGSESIQVDVRVLAATHRDLASMINQGTFREDLFYRLNVVSIDIPPLRRRRADIAPLIEHFLALYTKEQQNAKLAFSREAWDMLLRYDYPGNVRELENIVQRVVLLSRGNTIVTDDLPQAVLNLRTEQGHDREESSQPLPERVERLEKELVLEALRIHGGNQSRAANALGISERNLRYRLKKWGMRGQ